MWSNSILLVIGFVIRAPGVSESVRYLDGWSVTEIAEELELTYRAAESGLARARRSFLAAWEEVQ